MLEINNREWLNRCLTIVLIIVTFSSLNGCAAAPGGKAEAERSAMLEIHSQGIVKPAGNKTELLLHFIQYTLDGKLIQAHLVKKNYHKKLSISPGRHRLYIEKAYRGILSGRALLEEDGDCFTFYVNDGQTAVFNGKAISESKWRADGFDEINYTRLRCRLEKCTRP